MAREAYIYWKVPGALAVAIVQAVRGAHAELLARHPSLHSRLLHRADMAGERMTWMEIHALPGQDVDDALLADIEATAARHLAPLGDGAAGPRHVELFVTAPG